MSFTRALAGLIALTNIVFSILPSELVFTPYAEFPSKNQTELGYQLSFNTVQATTHDKGLYFNHSFSKNIRYGIEFYEGEKTQQIFHHFAYRLGSLFKGSTYHLVFSGGIDYLSTTKPILKNEPVHEGTLTTTWAPNESPFRLHLTAARTLDTSKVIGLGAISFQKKWGIFAFEWDGDFLNLSSQFEIHQRLKLRGGITKNMRNNTELLFKTSIGFIDIDTPVLSHNKNELENTRPEKVSTINASVGLKHIQEGMQFYYNGEYRKAQKSYEIAVEFFPKSAIARERLGSIYFKLSEYEKAQIEWEKANILAPSDRLKEYIKQAKEKGESLY
jgi:hypothetical protein